jgi:hypothetical protein
MSILRSVSMLDICLKRVCLTSLRSLMKANYIAVIVIVHGCIFESNTHCLVSYSQPLPWKQLSIFVVSSKTVPSSSRCNMIPARRVLLSLQTSTSIVQIAVQKLKPVHLWYGSEASMH